jgi:uncharacterized protein (DUF302 family)
MNPARNGLERRMDSIPDITSYSSPYSVPETLDRLEALLRQNNITIFARVDHAGEAQRVELHMPPTQVLIFGNPQAGTPIMLAEPLAAIDLPLKALAWQDAEGKVWLSYNEPEYLRNRFHLAPELLNSISGLAGLIRQAIV